MRPHLPRALERYWALTRKEFQQVRRNGKMMIQLTIPPTFLLLVLGYALNPEVKDLRVAVVDMDGGRHARELAAELDTLSTFDITRRFYGLQEADRAMARRQVDMALVFPPLIALLIGVTHLLVDTRVPVRWWMRVVKRMREDSPGTGAVEMGVDQVFHIMVIAFFALVLRVP